jgi:branched-chain amino acid transport system ATP-binding protein
MLEIRNLSAGFGKADVLRGIEFHVEAGELIALLGPNGAGKSTLMKSIIGVGIHHRQGEIMLDGENIIAASSHDVIGRGLAIVPEGRMILAPMTVEDNLRLGATRLNRSQGHSLAEMFEYVFDLFPRLHERSDQIAGTLSGGEQQMLAIGRALMSAPRILLLDEPFLGLAPIVVQEILDALTMLKEAGLTQVLVEQKLDIALALASRAYVLIKGEVALMDTAKSLAARKDLDNLYFALASVRETEEIS